MATKCILCRRELVADISWGSLFSKEEKRTICTTCESKLDEIGDNACEKCGRRMNETSEIVTCQDCKKWSLDKKINYLQKNVACYEYNAFAKELMALYKYRGDYAVGVAFSPVLRTNCMKLSRDIIIPVPISPERRVERGFNQTEGLLKFSGIPFETYLRRAHTEKQSKKTRRERIEQEQFFFVENNEAIKAKEILLLDDIYTTGATLHLAAEALINEGAKSVSSLTIFR
ncbi:ComF family protein [Listeria grandensis]|uniref:ComF family protein n=1 Tax=Listeria grandensis TaxID=1494963 RepID=A0A7X1CPA6_9LIST|nr:ComF family protein [Listeria grandensis]MBC1474672.1 ComF family protein [Listeria grandensis]MBC1935799.1 ComF family protein [Listeria grandensis]